MRVILFSNKLTSFAKTKKTNGYQKSTHLYLLKKKKKKNNLNQFKKIKAMKKTYKNTISEYSLKYTKTDIQKTQIKSSQNSVDVIRKFYFDDINIYESFFILLLNRANNTTGFAKISQGGTAGTVVDIKIIAKYAVESLSSAVIICHNHPSGNKQPSDADLNITRKIKDALLLLDIKLIDHIIITENDYYSFADNGDL